MNRNRNLDLLRALALLLVMIYHGWVLMGSIPFASDLATLMVMLGGEIGVTTFFALSGYGIYCSLENMERREGKINYCLFLKKRAVRIYPEYLFCIIVLVLISFPQYLTWNGFKNIVTHLLLIHNLFPAYSGSINGVLWTMGVIVQFYLIAPFLYKFIKKYGVAAEIVCIVFTVAVKAVMYAIVLPAIGRSGDLAFFAGRQLITALDNFSIGMFAAYLRNDKKAVFNSKISAAVVVAAVVGLLAICRCGMMFGIHTNNLSGYIWHSFLAFVLGSIMFFISNVEFPKGIIYKCLLWLSEYEYGIYIWHLLILNKLVSYFENKMPCWWYIYIIYLPLSILVGFCISYVLKRIQKNLCRRGDKRKNG